MVTLSLIGSTADNTRCDNTPAPHSPSGLRLVVYIPTLLMFGQGAHNPDQTICRGIIPLYFTGTAQTVGG